MKFDDSIVRLLWHIVSEFENKTGSYTKDDLFQEARIAAAIAMAKYDASKKTKISTYIYSHVSGHLRNLKRSLIAETRREESYTESMSLLRHDNDIETLEFVLTMKKILSNKEYAVLILHFVKGHTLQETAKILKTAKQGVVECSRVILRKYELLEKSLRQGLTQTRLQSSWLEASPPSQNE